MRVRDLIRQKPDTVITVHTKDDLQSAIRLLVFHDIGGLPVLNESGSIVGFVSERDIVRTIYHRLEALTALRVQDVMRPAAICDADDKLTEAMSRMTIERQRHLVVCDNGRVAGMLSLGDIVKHQMEQLKTETGVLRDYVAAHRAAI